MKSRVGGIKSILSTCRTAYNWAAKHRLLPPYAAHPFSAFPIDAFGDRGQEDTYDIRIVMRHRRNGSQYPHSKAVRPIVAGVVYVLGTATWQLVLHGLPGYCGGRDRFSWAVCRLLRVLSPIPANVLDHNQDP